ncbi:hypothetical protein LXN10_02020 [Arcobacter sp. KX21116]|jgi:hypothetical protein|uniref:hypothetical protein n=1 Tax=Arcobacter iocasae TaxID=2906515 RepID=UPI0035D495B7
MKTLVLILILISFSFSSSQYTFLVNKYDKEIDLEAKIIAKIANSSLRENIKLFIPNITSVEKKVYSKYFILTNTCEESNFVFVKNNMGNITNCSAENKLFFTNNYRKLLSDKKFFGAFFWNKSRPNIVFIKTRLKKRHIKLPKNYDQFVEDFDER